MEKEVFETKLFISDLEKELEKINEEFLELNISRSSSLLHIYMLEKLDNLKTTHFVYLDDVKKIKKFNKRSIRLNKKIVKSLSIRIEELFNIKKVYTELLKTLKKLEKKSKNIYYYLYYINKFVEKELLNIGEVKNEKETI